jgi:shikimate dehydrogenase
VGTAHHERQLNHVGGAHPTPVPSASLIEKCCLIANPAAGNPTHYLVEQAFAQAGLDWRFMTFEVAPEQLGDAMRGIRALGFHGVKVGEPFNETVVEHLDDLSDVARRCGSVNYVTANSDRLVGDNTEGTALVELLRQHIDPVGRKAVILGAGRVARAIAIALVDAGMTTITVASRKEDAGQKLVELIGPQSGATATFVPLDGDSLTIEPETALVINATSQGSTNPDANLPINVETLAPKIVVADVAYNTSRTWLTHQAGERGCRIIDGLSLYVEQTALAFRAWTSAMPDTVSMREAAEEFLGI